MAIESEEKVKNKIIEKILHDMRIHYRKELENVCFFFA